MDDSGQYMWHPKIPFSLIFRTCGGVRMLSCFDGSNNLEAKTWRNNGAAPQNQSGFDGPIWPLGFGVTMHLFWPYSEGDGH